MTGRDIWIDHFGSEFIPQIRRYRDVWETRLLPAIGDLEREAKHIEREEYERLGFSYDPDGPRGFDESDISEQAWDAGMKHFLRFAPFRQGIINMYVVGLYHFIEQQCFLFYRMANQPKLNTDLKFKDVEDWLNGLGIAVKEFNSWPKVERLMLAANCVKHSEGRSCRGLKEKEPGWFIEFPDMQQAELRSAEPRSIEQPIFGQGIYLDRLTLWDLTDATIAFWDELGSAFARLT